MIYLDCHDLETTLASFAGAIGVGRDKLVQALRGYDELRLQKGLEDPWALMPREVLGGLGTTIQAVQFDGVFYFHGTRVLDPELIKSRGILPLHEMVEHIWEMLYSLVREERTDNEWAAFRRAIETGAGGHHGYLYRLRTSACHSDPGPFALLVRETFFDPEATGSHDYLGCPEIVQDIAICYRDLCGIDLESRFYDASRPCIVKFRSTRLLDGAIKAALWYAFSKLREGRLTSNSNWSFDGEGVAISPKDVWTTEVVNQ